MHGVLCGARDVRQSRWLNWRSVRGFLEPAALPECFQEAASNAGAGQPSPKSLDLDN